MEIIKLHPDLIEPTRGTDGAAGYDLYMPVAGATLGSPSHLTGLGFAAKVPKGFVALILPRSSAGVKHGIHLGNTVGVIDSDYEGEWKVNVRGRLNEVNQWAAGERLFQFIVVPAGTPTLKFVDKFSEASARGEGGFGSTNEKPTRGEYAYLPVRNPDAATGFSFQRSPVYALSKNELGWYLENKAMSNEDRQNPSVFLELFNKWFGA